MFEYVALICDRRIDSALRAAADIESLLQRRTSWQVVFDNETLRVLCTTSDRVSAHVTVRPRGVILGSIFQALHIRSPDETAIPESAAIDQWLEDDALVRESWGEYVAFHCATAARRVRVYKDPTGSLPCLRVSHGEVHLFASRLSTLHSLRLARLQVNGGYLHRRLAGKSEPALCESLSHVTPMLGGERVEIDLDARPSTVNRQQLWSPLSFTAEREALEHPAAARCALHTITLACTRAWVQRYPAALLRLSGGLDSSIVLGCIARSGATQRLTGYTYFDPRGRSDERRWARAAASHSGIICLELPFSSDDVHLPEIASLQPTLEPISTVSWLQRSRIERRLCVEHGAEVVFTGLGGDSGFCRDTVGLVVPEYLQRNGWRADVFALSAQVASYTDLSFWQVLFAALRRRAPAAMQATHARVSRLVNPELLETAVPASEPHPWLSDGVLPSVPRRLAPLLQPREFYDISATPGEEAPVIVSPLLSQPVVETCLRIPAYVHFEGGSERGLARHAFSQEVPAAIRQRCWKDRAPGFLDRILAANRAFVREFLLDGVLVRDRLLSKPAVETALTHEANRNEVSAIEILNHLDTEAWLRHWQ